jgi:hypothetical protein
MYLAHAGCFHDSKAVRTWCAFALVSTYTRYNQYFVYKEPKEAINCFATVSPKDKRRLFSSERKSKRTSAAEHVIRLGSGLVTTTS